MANNVALVPATSLLARHFKNTHLSNSRLRRYEQCARSFFLNYVSKGTKMPRDNDAASFGIVLHVALEMTYDWVCREEYDGDFPMDEATVFYRDAWRDSELASQVLYQEGLQILREYARKNSKVDHRLVVSVEEEFNVDVGGFVVNGFIDRIDRIEGRDDALRVIDYKSGKNLFSKEDLEDDLQMSIYALAMRELYPWAKEVEFVFHMLRHGVVQEARRTRQQVDDAAGYVVALGQRTERDEKWQAKLGPLCAYCDFRHRCDAFQSAIATSDYVARTLDPSRVEDLVAERVLVAGIGKVLDGRQKEIDKILKAKVKEEGEFEAAGHLVRTFKTQSNDYDARGVLGAFEEAGYSRAEVAEEILSVETGAVRKLLNEAEEKSAEAGTRAARKKFLFLRAHVEAALTKKSGAPRIDVKPIKEDRT